MRRTMIVVAGGVALAAAAAVAVGLVGARPATAGPGTPGQALSVAAPRAAAIPPQTVPATVPSNPSQAVLVPVPGGNDFGTIPPVATDTPNLVPAGATYTADRKNLVVSLMNVDPDDATSGRLTVTGWGTYDATVAPNPGQLVYVDLPAGYPTSALPTVASESPNLTLFSVGYGYVGGVRKLVVNLGNPFPDTAVSGQIRIDW